MPNTDIKMKEKERKFWRNYNRFYHHYEESIVYQNFLKDLESLINPKGNEVWFDVGCGAGRIISLLKKKSGGQIKKIIGIDFDKNVLFLARRKFQKDIQTNTIEFLNIDISQKTIFKDKKFNGITANFVLPYIVVFENQYTGDMAIEMAIREMYRILKHGGRFIWSTLNRDFSLLKLFWNSKKTVFSCPENIYYSLMLFKYLLQIKAKNKRGIYHILSKQEIDVLLKKIGFSNIIYKESLVGQALIIKAEK